MRVSVIIPIYKVEKYISQCLNSVINQTYKDLEIILVDDGSPDKSGIICDEFSKKDCRIKFYHKKNGGLSSARNFGLLYATGEYIVFLDSDDYWHNNNFIEIAVKNLIESKAEILFFKSQKIYESGIVKSNNIIFDRAKLINVPAKEALHYLIHNGLMKACAWDKLIKRDLLINNDIKFEVGKLSEDQLWCGSLILYCKSFDSIPDIVHSYRQRLQSISSTISNKHRHDIVDNLKTALKIASTIDDIELRHLYYSFYSYEYLILCSISRNINNKEFNVKALKDLLQYGKQKKVKIGYLTYKLLGFEIYLKILQLYRKILINN